MNFTAFSKLSLLVSFLFAGVINAQNIVLSPQVIASQGGDFQNANFEISYTIGESAAVSTITNSSANVTLTQGFQQPDKFSIAIGINEPEGITSVNLYPNPATDRLFLTIGSIIPTELIADLFDATGRKVFASQKLVQPVGSQQFEFSIGGLAAGTYLIRLSSVDGNSQKIFRFNKAFY